MDDCITKPLDREQLKRCLERYLGNGVFQQGGPVASVAG